ncbi:MSMEG_6728 family protein [Gordonia paraffinivorans]|uniref:MSMEG_6728 family protein n=1 Tax=Gordonia paraffinivorans TaxID=175628 RepID=UPI001E3285B8|nr:MSMEG_6728 family protein [Gordonia paraffinivorans]MCD2145355.1 MSMEG_6728 family protein [Gordonia paraffinivorans]
MQTFLPYPDFARSAAVLDPARLGKQRVETLQILRALELFDYGWSNHPAVGMWRGHTPALVSYGLACVGEWTREPGRRDRASHRGVRAAGRRAWPVGVGVRRPDAAVARRRETPSQPPLRPAPQGPGLLPGGVRHDGHPRRPAVPLAGVSCAAAGSARRHRPLGHSCDLGGAARRVPPPPDRRRRDRVGDRRGCGRRRCRRPARAASRARSGEAAGQGPAGALPGGRRVPVSGG